MLDTFKKFLQDNEAHEMYISGVAGTGKTTELKHLTDYCMKNKINSVTCAYTHKAVRVLLSKLSTPTDNNVICTLHSYLKKRPTINDAATKLAHVDGNSQTDIPSKVDVIFIDEFSMIGEKDYMSLAELQYDEDGDIITKVVYIGDPNQLPPVKDAIAVIPKGKYCIKLTQIHRQANDNPLIETLTNLNDYINGISAKPLEEHKTFVRGQDIVKLYQECKKDKILLAYTNSRVQELNAKVQGYTQPLLGDNLFSPTTRKLYTLDSTNIWSGVDHIVNIKGDVVELHSKYKTLETLIDINGIEFFYLADEDGNLTSRAVVFGHEDYLLKSQDLAKAAVKANKVIEAKHKMDPKDWAKTNWSNPLAKERALAWKQYLAFKDNVICVDFAHAMTVHKSQGSTYEYVFLDTEDIGKCANSDYQLYLKLLYVGISRASKKVFTN